MTLDTQANPFAITGPGLYPGIPNDVYHAHPAPGSSTLKKVLDCPARVLAAQDEPEPVRKTSGAASSPLVLGNVIHTAVLEPDLLEESIAVIPEEVQGTKKDDKLAFKDWVEENEGRHLILPREMEMVEGIVEAVWSYGRTRALLSEGEAESSIFWEDSETGLLCKIRPDWLDIDRRIIVDLKSARDASPGRFSRVIEDLGYHFSAAMYLEGIAAHTGTPVKEWQFAIIAAEKTAPYLCSFHRMSDEHLAIGRKRYRRALRIFAECKASGEWPGYPDEFSDTVATPWALKELEDN